MDITKIHFLQEGWENLGGLQDMFGSAMTSVDQLSCNQSIVGEDVSAIGYWKIMLVSASWGATRNPPRIRESNVVAHRCVPGKSMKLWSALRVPHPGFQAIASNSLFVRSRLHGVGGNASWG